LVNKTTTEEKKEEEEVAAPIQSGLDEPAFYIKRQTHARTHARTHVVYSKASSSSCKLLVYLHSEKTHFLFTSLLFIVECATDKIKSGTDETERERESRNEINRHPDLLLLSLKGVDIVLHFGMNLLERLCVYVREGKRERKE
jgi:hypothetical protein